jgi:hypothetical protein
MQKSSIRKLSSTRPKKSKGVSLASYFSANEVGEHGDFLVAQEAASAQHDEDCGKAIERAA